MQVISKGCWIQECLLRLKLGSTWVRIQDVLALQRRDVIKLNRGIDDMAKVRIGSQVKFLGDIGYLETRWQLK